MGFSVNYGELRLKNVEQLAGSDDIPLKPGETYVLKVSEAEAVGFEYMNRTMNLPPEAWNRIELGFSFISLGDGTGYLGGRRELGSQKKRVATLPSKRTDAPPVFQKVGWSKTGMATPAPGGASGTSAPFEAECSPGCGRFNFVTDANIASCVDLQTPPNVCPRTFANPEAGKLCIKFRTVNTTCGVGQPCLKDEKDEAGTLTCGDCKDEDNDGYSTCDGDCDDSNTPEGFNTNPGAQEICANDRNDNCDAERKVDETPCCDASDRDDDGASDCDGDCNDDDPTDTTGACATPTPTPTPPPTECPSSSVAPCAPDEDSPGDGPADPDGLCCWDSPVLVDVRGDGFSLTDAAGGVPFDFNGDAPALAAASRLDGGARAGV